jgi:hypothetical protein
LIREERDPGVHRTFLLGSRTVIGFGHGFVRIYSTYLDDTIYRTPCMVGGLLLATGVTMTYAEAILLDRNLRSVIRSLGAPGIEFQRRSRNWFVNHGTI